MEAQIYRTQDRRGASKFAKLEARLPQPCLAMVYGDAVDAVMELESGFILIAREEERFARALVYKEEKTLWLARFDASDLQIGRGMLRMAADLGRALGAGELAGPGCPSALMGIALSERQPLFGLPSHPAFYADCFGKEAFEKQEDYLSFALSAKRAPVERLEKLAQYVSRRMELEISHCTGGRKQIRQLCRDMKEEGAFLRAYRLAGAICPSLSWVVKRNGCCVALMAALADFSPVLQPGLRTGLFRSYQPPNRNAACIYLQGCAPGYEGSGAILPAYAAAIRTIREGQFDRLETGQIHEDNWRSILTVEALGGKEAGRYRIFRKRL